MEKRGVELKREAFDLLRGHNAALSMASGAAYFDACVVFSFAAQPPGFLFISQRHRTPQKHPC